MASNLKQKVAEYIAERVKDGEVLGLGSGSTAELAVAEIGKRIKKEGIRVRGVPTSQRISMVATEAGIEVLPLYDDARISWAFDGADEIDPEKNLIKGRGGAMLLEKIVATRAGGIVVSATEDKKVKVLGEKFPVPVEVVPAALGVAKAELVKLGAKEMTLREGVQKYGPVVTEQGNFILDVRFEKISKELDTAIHYVPGVVETGLFFGLTKEVVLAEEGGIKNVA